MFKVWGLTWKQQGPSEQCKSNEKFATRKMLDENSKDDRFGVTPPRT